MIDLKQAVEMAHVLLKATIPYVVEGSILVEEVENLGDRWNVSLSFSVPTPVEPAGASAYAQIVSGLRGSSIRRAKRFTMDGEGNFLSMKEMA